MSLPVDAHLHLKVGVPLASDVFLPTGPHFESCCLRRYAFCQRCPLCSLTSGILGKNLQFSGMIWVMVAVSELVSCLRGILVVIWSSDRAACEDFRINKAWTQWHSHTRWIVSWFNAINQVCHHSWTQSSSPHYNQILSNKNSVRVGIATRTIHSFLLQCT
jgi:hypothetical protein